MAGQGSARVTLREIDQSLVRNPQLLPQGIPAAVVGTARKGPAFVPQTFANMQQFSETFGSMLERGEEGNSQRVGPLALNEWMRNAQAGTFLRVLGVGDGLKATLNQVTDAGFHVGHRLVQEQKNAAGQLTDVGKRGNNPHAVVNSGEEADAEGIGRTHFLGCFMEDSASSSFLKDAGIQLENSPSSITIRMQNSVEVADGSTLTLKFNSDPGDSTVTTEEVFTFLDNAVAQEPAAADDEIDANLAPALILADLANAINSAFLGTTNEHLTAVLTKDRDESGVEVNTGGTLVITSNYGDQLGAALNKMSATFNLKPANSNTHSVSDITVGSETSIVDSQDFFFAIPGAQAAGFTIEATANPADGDTLEFSLLTNDGEGGLSDHGVEYEFKTTLTGNAGNITSGAKVADVYFVSGAGTVEVQINSSDPKLTLKNLKAAIDRVASTVGDGSGQVSNHEGKAVTSLDATGSTLSIKQTVKGETGRSLADGDAASITKVPGGFTTLSATDDLQSSSDSSTSAANAAVTLFMFGGASGESDNASSETYVAPELTLALTDRPAENDEILIRFVDDDDDDGVATIIESGVVFKGNLASNGNQVLLADGATSGVQVHIGDDIQETMVNLKNAVENAAAGGNGNQVKLKTDVEVVLNDDANSITFKQKARDQGAAENTQSRSLTKVTLKMGNQAVFTNPDGDSLTGNSSAKTALFSGAGGGSAPVIRGILMTPQGIKATINPNSALAGFHADSDSPVLNKVSYGIDFGNTPESDLAGYVVGDVDSNQGFKLLLNGFTNSERPSVLDCSFDPSSSTYFAKVLNTDPTKIEEFGHYLYAHWDVHSDVAEPSSSGILREGAALGGPFANMIGFCLPANSAAGIPRDFENFQSRFRTARTPWIVSQFYSSSDASARPSTLSGGDSYKLFKLHSLDDGVYGNERFRLLIENVRYESAEKYGSFDVVLEKFDSNPIEGEALASWKNVNLDPSSRNFIARVIGDQHVYYDFDKDLDKQRLVVKGEFEPKNKYVRVEVHPDVLSGVLPPDILPVGFQGHAYLDTSYTDSLVEPASVAGNRVYFDGTDPTDLLAQAKVLPLDYVQNISRSVGATKEADSALAWGVKPGYRETHRGSNSELTEQIFNKSLASWTKFFPDIGANPAWVRDSQTNESFQNSFFSLEKIQVSVSNDVIDDDWADAEYIRKSAAPADSTRFVNIAKDAKSSNVKYLKFRCLFQGGFDGVNIFDDEKAKLTSVAAVREGQDETGESKLTGPTVAAYQRAIDVLTDKSATEFQLLVIPGQRSPVISDYAIDACEDRFDALYLMDIIEKDANDVIVESSLQKPHVRNTIKDFSNRVLNTSFAASYFPDVSIRKTSDRSIVDVPPSVGMVGVMSQSDALADPWFAPAGLSRGRLVNALDAKVQMNRDLLDELYDADINPLYVPAGRSGEVYAFGQKTLLQSESALDRINVRRLLIDIRRKVKAVGEQLLFEPNRASTLAKFSSLVEPIMADVQKRRGVTRYKVQIDTTTTTQNDIENNTIRGKVYLQPTKSVEFISLDFVVTNTID